MVLGWLTSKILSEFFRNVELLLFTTVWERNGRCSFFGFFGFLVFFFLLLSETPPSAFSRAVASNLLLSQTEQPSPL